MKMRKRLCALFGFLAAFILAMDGRSARAEDDALRICFNDWPPYTFVHDGVPGGISVDLARLTAERIGKRAVFSQLPWNRCLDAVREGKQDAILDAADRPEFRQGPTSFSAYSNTFWVRVGDPARRYAPEILRGRRIGLVHGYYYPEDLLDLMRSASESIDYSVDDATNLRKLAFGRVDAVIADLASTLILARTEELPLRPLSPSHSADALYVSFNARLTGLQREFDAALRVLIESGAADRVYHRHVDMGICEVNPRATGAGCTVNGDS